MLPPGALYSPVTYQKGSEITVQRFRGVYMVLWLSPVLSLKFKSLLHISCIDFLFLFWILSFASQVLFFFSVSRIYHYGESIVLYCKCCFFWLQTHYILLRWIQSPAGIRLLSVVVFVAKCWCCCLCCGDRKHSKHCLWRTPEKDKIAPGTRYKNASIIWTWKFNVWCTKHFLNIHALYIFCSHYWLIFNIGVLFFYYCFIIIFILMNVPP